ncbi:MAG: pyridoxal phosphate-dependent aminotransferase [Bacteroidales bacterium]|nr:pyridoxal phosphate-dependent aminotransferase [Bacteroidales bacterium]MBD5302724.1 pyridoxal phosphate-dependent aminotransferase [Bacteroides sp.]MBD5347972.1 pyridoxal phosphate-dependent aminotransferase [Bacteroides sp.]
MIQISQRVQNLAASATLAMLQKTNELRSAGVDVIGMSAGEPDFNTPDHIKEAACKAIEENYSRYTAVAGYESLRRAVCDKLQKENGLEYDPSQIVVGNGAKQELANALMAVINPGDEVLIPVPAWVSYVEMVKLAEGQPVLISATAENNFKITPAQLESAITPKSRMLMLNSPCNPTGSVYSAGELQALAEVLAKYPDILILSDEIYEHINFVGGVSSIASCPGMKDRTIVVNGVSKAYAMTGWRIGYLAAPAPLAKAVTKLQGQYTSGASSIAQKAAEAAYTGSQDCVKEMCSAFERRRDLICSLAAEIPGWKTNRPEGAFYLFPDVRNLIGKSCGSTVINSSADYVMYLLEEAHVACVDGAAFCADGYIRLSYATSDENIREAMRRIRVATECLV